ncbi:MAG: DUF2330 domain-containing protein [Polyangiaceae bacterium]
MTTMITMVGLAAVTASSDAWACGGCFHQEEQSPEQVSVVTGHTMALSISGEQTVLWDQVQYAGSPEEFAWVLPVKPGAWLEVANDAWFEALGAGTLTQISPPELACDTLGFGCGAATIPLPAAGAFACSADEVGADGGDIPPDQEPDPVTVVHEGSVGPYETVTLSTDEPDALPTWLTDNGYAIADDVAPILEDYALEGFDFIALKLAPEQGVQQMKPVRVVMPGAVAALPLRMVAAGTGARTRLTLYVIGEGRWQTANFPAGVISEEWLEWNFDMARSNYSQLLSNALVANGGRTWVTTYARPRALLSPQVNYVTAGPTQYVVDGTWTQTIADAYARSAWRNGESDDIANCQAAFQLYAESGDEVVAPCEEGEPCSIPGGFIDAAELKCGLADDLAVALTGMRPRDVWVTRLDADLPREALADDLVIEAEPTRSEVYNWLQPSRAIAQPCPLAASMPRPRTSNGALLALLTLGGLFAGMTLRRRRRA